MWTCKDRLPVNNCRNIANKRPLFTNEKTIHMWWQASTYEKTCNKKNLNFVSVDCWIMFNGVILWICAVEFLEQCFPNSYDHNN